MDGNSDLTEMGLRREKQGGRRPEAGGRREAKNDMLGVILEAITNAEWRANHTQKFDGTDD